MLRFAACLVLWWLLPLGRAAEAPRELASGSKVEWARVITRSGFWDRHTEKDPEMLARLRTMAPLNIEGGLAAAKPGQLKELCQYPFLFADNIAQLRPEEMKNIAEYLRRGGFLLIDRCAVPAVNRDPESFLKSQVAALEHEFPNAKIATLLPEDRIYSIYFKMSARPPQAHGNHSPLYGVFVDDRALAVISLSGLQCAWCSVPTFADSDETIRMVVNIYVYAMTRTPSAAFSTNTPTIKR